MKYIFKAVNFIILAVILQGLYFLALIYTLANLSPYIHYTMTALGIFCVFFIISGREAAVYRLSWAVPILLFPAVMGVVYLFYKSKVIKRKLAAKAQSNAPDYIARYIENTTGIPPASYSDAEYFSQGEDFFERFLHELSCARNYIFIEFFIIERGVMWDTILNILVRKRNEGVQVRLVFDGFGSLYTLPRGYYKNMRRMGIECMVFNPVRSLLSFKLNTRNHRKTAIIDGETAFCGGLNLADNYINAKRTKAGHWKDSAVMVRGEAARNMTLSFLAMWECLTGEACKGFRIPSKDVQCAPLQGTASFWHDVPLDNESVSERILLHFINRANDYVYVITPYLSPSEELITALCTAARAGTDVRVMLPFIPDKFIVSMITKSNYRPLLEAGVRIFEYPPGFIHSKNIVADDCRAAVSTVNFDYRALNFNHECGLCFFGIGEGEKIIMDIKRDFTATQKNSREITLDAYRRTGLFERGVRRVCRIFAPLV
jgi:cardiolipin synthase